jgi:FkbM family methyltransferase
VASFAQRAIFVVTIYNCSAVLQQLRDMGCPNVVPFEILFHAYPEVFLPYLGLDVPARLFEEAKDVLKVLETWEDDLSRQEYVAQLIYHTSLVTGGMPAASEPSQTYFPSDLIMRASNEVFVDCGAFEGDTIREYLAHSEGIFNRIIAYEPDPENCRKARDYVSTLPRTVQDRITIHQAAVTRRTGRVLFDFTGSAASSVMNRDAETQGTEGPDKITPFAVSRGAVEIDAVALDDALTADMSPYFIKMDVEGAEFDALSGASKLIRQSRAVWAIALYHRQTDLWRIPLLLRSLSDKYHLFLRRYSEGFAETVCYAVPDHRLARTEDKSPSRHSPKEPSPSEPA